MIKQSSLKTAMYEAMRTAVVQIPPDVSKILHAACTEETDYLARMHMETFFENAAFAMEGKGLICGDTGFPLFFFNIGNKTRIEGGITGVQQTAEKVTSILTDEAFLRPTMVDPLSRENPGNNIGSGMPKVEFSFSDDIEGIEIVAAPKGGGSEIFGTFYSMLFPSDGIKGVKIFILDCIKKSCYAGKVCPPAIIGVGIGGTSDLCMSLAKRAALLRKLGSFNKDEKTADLERELLDASRKLGIGPMGARGINAAVGIHIETAYTHTAALPVAFNAQCLIGRRWKAFISADNKINYSGEL